MPAPSELSCLRAYVKSASGLLMTVLLLMQACNLLFATVPFGQVMQRPYWRPLSSITTIKEVLLVVAQLQAPLALMFAGVQLVLT